MINRILIRIKTVQILYSYLLTRSEFKIEQAPETTSRDRRYAYIIYMRTLLLLLELSGYSARSGASKSPLASATTNRHLHDNAVGRSLSGEDAIRKAILKDNFGIELFDPVLEELYNEITGSAAYRSYTHTHNRDIETDVKFWAAVIPTIFAKNEKLIAICRANDDFTNRGFNDGIRMAVETLTKFSDNRSLLSEARTSLDRSLDKAYELYHSLLLLPIELTRLEEERLEAARNKFIPSPEDLNPNLKFVDNEFVKMLEDNTSFIDYRNKNPFTWNTEPLLLRSLLDSIKESEIYKEYMDAPVTDLEADCEFWRQVMRNIILPSDELAEVLESSSVYWNDDLEIMGTFVLKTIRKFAGSEGKDIELLPKFKDEEDEEFGEKLFMLSVDNLAEYRALIERFINTDQWDSERLAFMDIVIMVAAIAELLNFPLIPIPVTLNEYIEIANYYSTPKSGQFINGILYSVITHLKEEGKLIK